MDRLAGDNEPRGAKSEAATRMYQRMLAGWASDLLGPGPNIAWPGDDPIADYRDRNWASLYTGSILDD